MKDYKRHLITAALPYANGPVHIGHLAGVYIPADIYARYLRLKGKEAIYVCGSDEHGVPITIKARNENKTPQEIVDRYHKINKESFEKFGISFDIYSRTSSKIHHKTSADIFKKLHTDNKFIEKTTEQYFDEEANQFLADRYITGTCPHCQNEEAYGDQCEKCGTSLSPNDLINPKSAISGSKPVKKETKHWYLPLDQYSDFLEKWILEDHKEWKPNVYGQCKSWIKDIGLESRAVTRDLDWGVPVPVEGADGKVLYVWFDAPIGYISNTIEWAEKNGKDWKKYWQDDETRLVHFIGKDNIVFHCIIFPIILKSHGDFILTDNVPANEFLNLEGDKISTSKNWAVWLHEYLEDFQDKEDVLRYVLTANAPETKDNDFTWKDFQARNNNELVAILGNFVNRALVLTHKYFDGILPEISEITEYDKSILQEIPAIKTKVEENLENFKIREALKEAMSLARLGNKYLADTEPWKIFKTDVDRVKTILNISLQISANLSMLLEPFLPKSAKKLADFLAFEKTDWENIGSEILLSPGHKINKAKLLFAKIEDKEVEVQIEKLLATKKQNIVNSCEANPQKESIAYDDFMKMDIRTGTIISAEKVKKTKKLLKLEVDTGIDRRTMISGIAEYHKPEDIIGKQVSILVNLEARKIRGVESQGMILMAENADGELVFVSPAKNVSNGSEVK
ncbi:MAG: methionine--tRNA ligase [Bacteroidetes bacterium]|jgi:methionyl-tRNA synthetase|nr:methionine--tRNA ligase [Bacteroidota bacterium]MBT6686109.1 methionine--tRNA ligase [Bacteroidota bacterium]MBT7143253.1 methionine--tRNA ligase [Bacteroidota bacterium]MBT7493401.1 methionine--tRNA ligase [Bacteroidota bacterium]